MTRLYKKLLLLNLLICISYVLGNSLDKKEQPEWFDYLTDGKVFYGPKIVIVSEGKTKYEAIIYGISLFTKEINSEHSGFTTLQEFDDSPAFFESTSTTLYSQTFGNISIKGRIETYLSETGSNIESEIEDRVEEIVKVKYKNDTDSLQYSYFFQETYPAGLLEPIFGRHLEISETNCNIDCLLKELRNVGFNYKFYFDESQVWFLLEKDTAYPNLKEKIKKYKEMLDEGLITQEAHDAKMNQLLGL